MPFIIEEDATIENITPANFSRGMIPRDFAKVPHGSLPFAEPFPLPLIPRHEWQARIEEGNATKSFLSHIRRAAGLKSQDQDGIPYCWIHAVISAVRLLRARQNQPAIALSATACGAQIKNFRSEGGWSTEGLEWVVKHGIPTVELWPENKLDRRYLTAEMKADALTRQVTEWWDLKPRNIDEEMTCYFLRIPISVGYNRWRHAVCGMDPVYRNGQYGRKIWNSWTDDYGDMGEADLMGDSWAADDQIAPRVTDAS